MLLYETILDKYTTLELKGNSKCMDFKPFLEQTGCYLQQRKSIFSRRVRGDKNGYIAVITV